MIKLTRKLNFDSKLLLEDQMVKTIDQMVLKYTWSIFWLIDQNNEIGRPKGLWKELAELLVGRLER